MTNSMKPNKSILKRLKDLDHSIVEDNVKSKLFASALVALSGIVLYADKALVYFGITFALPDKFAEAGMDMPTFVWLWAQTLSPLLIIMGAVIRPYIYAYIVPIFCYILQIFFLLFDSGDEDFSYVSIYVMGTSLLVFFGIIAIKKALEYQLRNEIEQMRKDVLDEKESEKPD